MQIHVPPMQFKDEAAKALWEKGLANNQDPYGNACYRFASEWATRMEAQIQTGGKIKDIAAPCCKEADTEGITGFMYGCAVGILADLWKHGEALRLWHNLTTQLQDEGEKANEAGTVLNPAILNIGNKEN